MGETHYIHPDDEEVKAGPMPWTVEKSVTTPERQAINRLCDAVEVLAANRRESGGDAELQRVGELLAEVRELVKPETTVIFDPSNPEAAAPSDR